MQIIIENKIQQKIQEYQKNTGATKKWIAKKAEMLPQTMNKLIKKDNITLETLIKFAYALDCKPEELYSYKIRK